MSEVRVSQVWVLGVLLAVLLLAGGCSLGDDDDNGNGGEAAGDTGQAEAGGGQGGDDLLAEVQERGTLRCGVNDAVPGFGFQDEAGEFQGFDIDFCHAVAAAVLGDPEAVEFRVLTPEQRFTALQAREVDVLIRNTTWTASRDGTEGARFLYTTFYDGQGMMVREDSGYESLEDMDGETICVLSGTTTELNLESRFQALGVDYEPLAFEDNEPLQEAFVQERCGAWTSDKSQLAGVRSNFPEGEGGPESLVILDETMSKEPLGPVVRDGDDTWADAVNWAVIATVQAEELGISSENIDEMLESDDPDIQLFLGQPVEGEPFDPGLGLEPEFAVDVIRAVGNYGEIYDRNVGPETTLGLERGPNELWTKGGLHYAPPYR
ncbi:MAG TPA: amino acid ABC transporter substrate-binding protein [Gaiellaceae bacterium]|nr:amino acid ABC transporter substrate-binding protein [Gaiellaceae bacterium]